LATEPQFEMTAEVAAAAWPEARPLYLVALDGGGTATRARLVGPDGRTWGQGRAGPSALALGVETAWRALEAAIEDAFHSGGCPLPPPQAIALGIGVAGAECALHLQALRTRAGNYACSVFDSDAYTSLLGAHGGGPGAVIAVGTGSVGLCERPQGQRVKVGGWGYPLADEGGGAWIGMRAMALATQARDGRRAAGSLVRALWTLADAAGGLSAWLQGANQTRYASLAPLVLEHAPADAAAHGILVVAGLELARMARTLDPCGELPLALCGGLAAPLHPYLPGALIALLREPQGSAVDGALLMLRRHLGVAASGVSEAAWVRPSCLPRAATHLGP
jgi:glucosamine kinase